MKTGTEFSITAVIRISVLAQYLQVQALVNWKEMYFLTVHMINTTVVETRGGECSLNEV